MLLKDSNGGDTTSFVKNGEWDLIGWKSFFLGKYIWEAASMKELIVKIIVYKSFLSLEFQLFLSTSKFPVLGLPGVKNIATYEYGSYVDITFTIHIRWAV